jgi:hypothetical protein
MRLLPAHPIGRAAVALLAAAVVIACLHWRLQREVAAPPVVPRSFALSSPLATLGFRIAAVDGEVALVAPRALMPPTAAPVFEVLPEGDVVLRRPPPIVGAPVRVGGGAAIRLPSERFERMGPAARATALELLGGLCAERPVAAPRITLHGFVAAPRQLQMWLDWVP